MKIRKTAKATEEGIKESKQCKSRMEVNTAKEVQRKLKADERNKQYKKKVINPREISKKDDNIGREKIEDKTR